MTKEQLVEQISAAVATRVKELKENGDDPTKDEKLRKMVEEMLEKRQDLDNEKARGGPGFDENAPEKAIDSYMKGMVQIDDGVEMPRVLLASEKQLKQYFPAHTADKILEFQKINDELLILGTMLAGAKNKSQPVTTLGREIRRTKMYQDALQRLQADEDLKKALSTSTSGSGAEWIPTGFSSQLIEKVRLQLKVAALFPSVNMPTNPYKMPVESGGATGYLISESTSDTGTTITASTPSTSNFTFNAIKLAGRVLFSSEVDEDAIINIMDFVSNSLTTALREAQETSIINGDDSTTHQDSDVTSSTDARKAYKGLRYYALNNTGTTTKDAANANLSTSLLRGTRILMGKYGVDPSKLAWICSPVGYIQWLSISEVLTLDKYGANATIINGEIGRFDGVPIIASEYMRDDLNATGVYDGTTTDRTGVLLVYTPGFWIGNRLGITLATDTNIDTDQVKLIAKMRVAFEDPYNALSEKQSVMLYNVKTTL
ncbi:MAG: phage major capsid protein [Calditrichaeota bacterium]|nr:phage major capsid protein [Calditrichota bacterium]